MRVVYEKQFRIALKEIVDYIAEDKVSASKLFKKELKEKFELVMENPKMYEHLFIIKVNLIEIWCLWDIRLSTR